MLNTFQIEYPTTPNIADMVTYSVKLNMVSIVTSGWPPPSLSYCARASVGALVASMTSTINMYECAFINYCITNQNKTDATIFINENGYASILFLPQIQLQ